MRHSTPPFSLSFSLLSPLCFFDSRCQASSPCSLSVFRFAVCFYPRYSPLIFFTRFLRPFVPILYPNIPPLSKPSFRGPPPPPPVFLYLHRVVVHFCFNERPLCWLSFVLVTFLYVRPPARNRPSSPPIYFPPPVQKGSQFRSAPFSPFFFFFSGLISVL